MVFSHFLLSRDASSEKKNETWTPQECGLIEGLVDDELVRKLSIGICSKHLLQQIATGSGQRATGLSSSVSFVAQLQQVIINGKV